MTDWLVVLCYFLILLLPRSYSTYSLTVPYCTGLVMSDVDTIHCRTSVRTFAHTYNPGQIRYYVVEMTDVRCRCSLAEYSFQ
jgi:hypothetical protein